MSSHSPSPASSHLPHTVPAVRRITLRDLQARHRSGEPIPMLTAYDATMAALVEQSGVDLILVGDSLGNVVLGLESTIPVKLEDMIRHTASVVRGTRRAFVVADLPFGCAADPETALRSSIRLFQETGCQAVKLEGGSVFAPTVRRLVEQGIPVMAHIGLTPQSVHQQGGYRMHGRSPREVELLLQSARDLAEAGAFAIVLECVTPDLAREITGLLPIPTIGIGSGRHCSGQVLVINDLIGLGVSAPPKFATPRANVALVIRDAVASFAADVRGSLESRAAAPPQASNSAEARPS